MTTATIPRATPGRSSEWARKYPPLLAVFAALVIALAVLPSALNLPQSNPSTTLEYAPIPPDDESPPPPAGNFSSLGLGSSGTLGGGTEEGGPAGGGGLGDDGLLGQDPGGGEGKSPRTKRCVGSPPKQTDDPLAPPCVADFTGDNFGTTYLGVSREEVKILFYIQGFTNYTNICRDPARVTPDNEYFDLWSPAQDDEHCVIRVLRGWQQYFYDRYQTYNRRPHFFVYFSGEGDSPELRRADAADNYAKVKPFAVIATSNSYSDAYLETMAKRGVLNFDSQTGREAQFFQRYPKLIWGYYPTLEISAQQYAGYVCKKVKPFKVSFSGNAADAGKDRVYGMFKTRDETRPDLIAMAEEVKRLLKEQCGIVPVTEPTFPSAGYVADTRYGTRYATEAVAQFQTNKVTTILWPGGLETNLSKQAGNSGYLPEVVALGDQVFETETHATFQDQNFWDQVRMITNVVRQPPIREQQCFKSYREVEPEADLNETSLACDFYNGLRQLFTGIQVSGPRLTPTTVDKGYRAIPKIRSTDPFVPACFYEPGDYTCVKDAVVERWDAQARDQATTSPGDADGCYRMTEAGLRYFAEAWPDGDVTAQEKPDDPCNDYDGSFLINNSPPEDPGDL